jgi:hypothetical protein
MQYEGLYEFISDWVSGLSDDALRTAIWRSLEIVIESPLVAPLVWRLGLAEAEKRDIAI